jgi:hypothetical protein
MSASNETDRQEPKGKSWQRRGLFAAAWATVIGAVMKSTTERVEAAASFQYADTTATVTNTSSGSTVILASDANYSSTESVLVGQTIVASAMAGIQGVCGLRGPAPIRCGVFGDTGEAAPSAGVYGNANSNTVGVIGRGEAAGTGVLGQSLTGLPIMGQVAPGSSANTIAIYGLNNSTFAGPFAGAGGFGVLGNSSHGHGVVGVTGAAGAAAVAGTNGGINGAFAGLFWGPVAVQGPFVVVGPKSAAVPHPDGTHRLLYCLESPESWFEDFGKAQLTCGQADVQLDPDFAAVVNLEDYHVFVTAYDADHVLHVTNQTKAGFRVQAQHEAASGRFSWRVVAKRKDVTAPRLEPVSIPLEPTMPTVSEVWIGSTSDRRV